MYILEQSITREYWKPIQDLIRDKINAGKYSVVPRSGGVMFVKLDRKTSAFAICDGWEPIGWVYLTSWGGGVYEVSQTFVLSAYRGNRYAEKLYKTAVNRVGITLMSGPCHSKYSRGLWKRFIEKRAFDIWADDMCAKKSQTPVKYVGNDLICDLEVYHDLDDEKDVRLFARRKNR